MIKNKMVQLYIKNRGKYWQEIGQEKLSEEVRG
jgi:hypothetical protein